MDSSKHKQKVAVCDSQPLTVAGLRALLESTEELEFAYAADSLAAASYLVRAQSPAILILDKAFGVQALLDWMLEIRQSRVQTQLVVWGVSISEAEALRFLQAGARGIVRKTADPGTLMACLRSVLDGGTWMEDAVFHAARGERTHRSELTSREQQVLELVEQGLKNKDIARQLGIRPGTVKIHLKHIFEKTGVRGRYGLALAGFRQRTGTSFLDDPAALAAARFLAEPSPRTFGPVNGSL